MTSINTNDLRKRLEAIQKARGPVQVTSNVSQPPAVAITARGSSTNSGNVNLKRSNEHISLPLATNNRRVLPVSRFETQRSSAIAVQTALGAKHTTRAPLATKTTVQVTSTPRDRIESDEDSAYGESPDFREEDFEDATDTGSVFSTSDAEEDKNDASAIYCQPIGSRNLKCGDSKCNDHKPSEVTKSAKMREFANRVDFEVLANWGQCNSECTFGKNCLSRVSNGATWRLRRSFWNHPSKPAPLPKERKDRITTLASICQARHHLVEVSFLFLIDISRLNITINPFIH